ncbi:MAG: epoxide hydrolase [Candidatus Tectomicrobia bacterium]|uniref:Epoxide hydrolase n=1 Tax=Tectimicrobiota bacterium TaxID=2528274 RepID=A0A937VXY2_UNCTE|nr:epoxide hydrolase [Candidatus Tectomicrobia bacterium]
MEVRPFTIHVPDDVLDDLRRRLEQTRLPNELPDTGWEYGSNLGYIRELVQYWRTTFDWRAQEAKLNRFQHYRTQVDGLDIHFIHERGQGPNPMPLIMTHGWPSCFFEMTKILPLLTDPGSHGGDPADAFDMIVPSLPGFGFSDPASTRGMDVHRVAGLWHTLMTVNLSYPRFAAQGGDIGAGVTACLGYGYADSLYGIHLTSITRPAPYLGPGSRPLTAAEQALIDQRARWQQDEGGYAHIQGTKPQTLAYGLNDSPAGLAAWIVEKYRTWSDCQGNVEARYTKDELLTIVTLYWVTQSIASSTRMYKENQRTLWTMGPDEKIPAPAGMAMFPQEIARPPREWGERSYHVLRWEEMPRGGHFAALEEPELLAQEVRAFFRQFRQRG